MLSDDELTNDLINAAPLASQDEDVGRPSRLFLCPQLDETQLVPSTEVAYRDLLQSSSSSEGESDVDVPDCPGGEEEHTSKTIESVVESVHSEQHDNGEQQPTAVVNESKQETIVVEEDVQQQLPPQEESAVAAVEKDKPQEAASASTEDKTVEDKQPPIAQEETDSPVEQEEPTSETTTMSDATLLLQVAETAAAAMEEEEAPTTVRKNQPRRASQFKTPQQHQPRQDQGPTPPSITKAYNEKVYASCWEELIAKGWKAKPSLRNLESNWYYLTPEARTLPVNEYVDGVNAFFSESSLLDYVKANFPEIYRRAQRNKKRWQQRWTEQSPASAESMQKKTKARAAQPKFNEVWQALKDVGWDWAKVSGDWCYVVPNAPLQHKDQLVQGKNYFTNKDELLEYLEHTGEMPFLEESEEAESSAQEEPAKTKYLLKHCLPVFEKDLWVHLETVMEWTYARGSGLVEYEFYLPNARSKKDGGKRNVDYFESRDRVYEYVSLNPEHLKGLEYEGKDMSTLEYTNNPHDRALVQQPKPVSIVAATATPVKRNKPASTKTHSKEGSFDREFDLKTLLPKFERDLWVHLQEEMGWTYEHGSGLVEYVFILPEGKAKKDGGKRNEDFFETEDKVYEYVAMHPEQLRGLKYKGRDMTKLKYAAKPARRSLSRNSTPAAATTHVRQVTRTPTTTKKRPATSQQASSSKKKKTTAKAEKEEEDLSTTTPWQLCWKKLVQRGWRKENEGIFYAPGYDASNPGADNESNFSSQIALWSWVEENDQLLFQQCVDQGNAAAAAAAAVAVATKPHEEEEDGEADEEMTPVRGDVKRSRYFEEPTTKIKVNEDEEERRREREAISTKEGENRIRQFNVSLSSASAVPAPAAVVKSPQKPLAPPPRSAAQQQALRPITTSTGLFKGMVFFLTGMEQDVAETMQRAITQQQGRLSNDVWGFKPGGGQAILLCQPGSFRTSTYLAAVARRLPILHPNWLWTCIQEDRLVVEYHTFEVPNSFLLHPTKSLLPADSAMLEHVPSSSWNNTTNVAPIDSIFQDLTFQILDNAKPIQRLVEAMGGRVISCDQQDDGSTEVIFLTPIEAYTDDIALRMMRRRPVYTFEWVAQCLLHGQCLRDKPAHCWFHPTPPPSTAITRLLESDEERGLIKPLVISLPQANAVAPVVSVEIFQLRGKRYYVGDFVLVCDPADGEPDESTATFGRIRKTEFDVDLLKYRLSVDVFHRVANTSTLPVLQWRKSRPRMEFDATSILQKFVCVPVIGDPVEHAQTLATAHSGCGSSMVDWKDCVYVLY